MFSQLYTGWSALRAANIGLDVLSQNIANAANPEYHRQNVTQTSLPGLYRDGLWFGSGVDVRAISRVRDGVLARAIVDNRSIQHRYQAQLGAQRHVETLLTPADGGLTGRVQALFGQFEQLSARPDDPVSRRQVIDTAQGMARELNRTATALTRLRDDIARKLHDGLREVQDLSSRIVALNEQILRTQAQNGSPNTLLDQRDALVQRLATLIDVDMNEPENFLVLANGGIILSKDGGQSMELQRDGSGHMQLVRSTDGAKLNPDGGSLAGLLDSYNELTQYFDQLDEIARSFMRGLDQQHAQGVGVAGSFTLLTSARAVANVTTPLATSQLPLQIQAGSMTVTIVNEATGERSLHSVDLDPQTDSLSDLAARLSTIPRLQATVNPATGKLAIFTEPGFQFDFTGGASTIPADLSQWTSSSIPTIHGQYTGTTNENLTVTVAGSGEVGVSDGLSLVVRNANGDVVRTLDVGRGYAAGDGLELFEGLKIQIPFGQLADGDEFAVNVVGQSDSTGALAALAINTLFVGYGASNFALHPDVLSDPQRLATGLTGAIGDAGNLHRLLLVRERLLSDDGAATIEETVGHLVAGIGEDVRQTSLNAQHGDLIAQRLSAEREMVSGVNPDEEMVRMIQYQRSYEAAARFIATMSDVTRELMTIVR